MDSKLRPLLFMAFVGLIACEAEEEPVTDAALETAPVVSTPEAAPLPPPAAGVTLTVTESRQYGTYLTDSDGRALYLLEGEPAGESTCHDACAEAWPPLTSAQGMPTAGDQAVQADLIGTIQRRDGQAQVTYNGHALYYYQEDQGPGQVTGQDLTDEWGEWYLVTPAGEHLEEEGS